MADNGEFANAPTFYLQRLAIDTFAGGEVLFADADLTPEQASRYALGMLVREPESLRVTRSNDAPAGRFRFAVATNSAAEEDGSRVIPGGARFKVLDICEHDGRTQIALLHLPGDEQWRLFGEVEFSSERDAVDACRSAFEDALSGEPAQGAECPTLQAVGFDEGGEPHPVETPLQERLKPLSEMGFREVDGSVLYVEGALSLFEEDSGMGSADFPDVLAYGYIDQQAGLSMQVLCSARRVGSKIERRRDLDEHRLIIRSGGTGERLAAQVVDSSLSEFSDLIGQIEEIYGPDDESLRDVRRSADIDPLRSLEYPDDIQAYLLKQGIEGMELVWMRTLGISEEGSVVGRLLNEPYGDYGVHEGDCIELGFGTGKDGGIVCVADAGRVAGEPAAGSRDVAVNDRPHEEPYVTCKPKAVSVSAEEYASGRCDEKIADRMRAIVDSEAPIEKTWLFNLVRASFGIGRSGRNVLAKNEEVLSRLPHGTTEWDGHEFVWQAGQDPESYTSFRANPERQVGCIAFEELRNAILHDLPYGFALQPGDAVSQVAGTFGYTRVASRIKDVISKAIERCVADGLLAQGDDGSVSAAPGEGFRFAAGVESGDPARVTEGYYRDGKAFIGSVSYEKLLIVLVSFIVALEGRPCGFFLEVPCTADEEDGLRKAEGDPLHLKVYHTGRLTCEEAFALLFRNRDLLLNTGLVSFGFFSTEAQAEVFLDQYKVVALTGLGEEGAAHVFGMAGIPDARPVTVWDTIGPETPARNFAVSCGGATLDSVLKDLEEDFGLALDHYEAEDEEGSAVPVDVDPGIADYVEPDATGYELANGAVVTMPATYREVEAMPDDPEGTRAFAMRNASSQAVVLAYPIDGGPQMPCDDTDEVVSGIRCSLGDDQGIVEVRSGGSSGSRFVYSIVKTAKEPSVMPYALVLDMRSSKRPVRIRGFFDESGTTGVRDSTVYSMLAQAGGNAPDGWVRDPYDAGWGKGLLANKSEQPEFDALFPEHPLTEARRLIRYATTRTVG
ncbi:DUF3320 domain-containing protein [Gordonibacter sp. Marseille-P4307]|uniref:DUF3320 domain-containing protein n=1 Tax=Gordonibacter sp. Marseille-P4307 TaxID=2161815 RepID=UPI000F51FE70|nr:DUF3320 domain-containing protein [Gordonibacter sp. Marseille-P4307]